MTMDQDELALNNFKSYLKIPSTHPILKLDDCVKFLEVQAASMQLPLNIFQFAPNKPVVLICCWEGSDPQLPSILLNSHMDVVPVSENMWTYPPFEAHMDSKGDIYARGSQDMKSVGIQYLEAIRRLRLSNKRFKRTVHLSFMPDEEIGGYEGMKLFVKCPEFRDLNVGFALDEGRALNEDAFLVRYGEKCIWVIRFHCTGQSGHGSLLHSDTCFEKVRRLLNKIYEFREEQQKKLEQDSSLTLGDVISINVTMISGGVQFNVIPDEVTFTLDTRIPITVDAEDYENRLNTWCKEAGEGVWMEFLTKSPQIPATKLDNSNVYWLAFKKAADELNIRLKPEIVSGATDSRYLRELGIPALGFSPMNNTPVLPHDHDERLNKDVFLRGINIYESIISELADAE